jgi:hypothetical protein
MLINRIFQNISKDVSWSFIIYFFFEKFLGQNFIMSKNNTTFVKPSIQLGYFSMLFFTPTFKNKIKIIFEIVSTHVVFVYYSFSSNKRFIYLALYALLHSSLPLHILSPTTWLYMLCYLQYMPLTIHAKEEFRHTHPLTTPSFS